MGASPYTNKDSFVDYRFAWRWLLPFKFGEELVLYGLTDAEQCWWREHFDLVGPQQAADGMLVALNRLEHAQIDNCLEHESPRWICAWGNGKAVDQFSNQLSDDANVRCYSLLPARMPRVVVPLSSPRAAIAGLRLHQPGRRLARLAMKLADTLASVGNYWLLRKQVLLIAYPAEPPIPAGAKQAGFAPANDSGDFSLYLGSPDSGRKTVALPVPITEGHSIIKAADNPVACEALRNEADALDAMRQTSLRGKVPELRAFRDDDTQVSLVQEYRQRCKASPLRQQQAVWDFLRALAGVDCSVVKLGDYLAALPQPEHVELVSLQKRLLALPQGTQLLLHRCHGDFAPWNCSWTEQGLFVFDWEASHKGGLLLSDAFYYALAPLVHVRHSDDGSHALQLALANADPLLQQSGPPYTDCRLYLALWLLQRPNPPALYCKTASALLEDWR